MATEAVSSDLIKVVALLGAAVVAVPLFRRLGIRTRQEIDAEKYALKAIRGDFDANAVLPVRP